MEEVWPPLQQVDRGMRISETVTLWGSREVKGEVSNLSLALWEDSFPGPTGVGVDGAARYSLLQQTHSKASLIQGALATAPQTFVSLHLGCGNTTLCQCPNSFGLRAGLNSHRDLAGDHQCGKRKVMARLNVPVTLSCRATLALGYGWREEWEVRGDISTEPLCQHSLVTR